MSLPTMVLSIGVIALIITLIMGFLKKTENWFVSLLQNYAGVLFIFSGWVKAVDPMGTAYKMEDYFAEFQTAFEGSQMSFISPVFPWFAELSIGFSVFMIVFEIVLGVMLLIGASRKFTGWAFFLLVIFFGVLTGFTFLTGYVPDGVNFFEFGKWGEYIETNMKVTDCGCFGDFVILKPFTSFMKDMVLLVPALVFLIVPKKMHQLFSKGTRSGIVVLSTIGLILYCMVNYHWNIPHLDFRPFKAGVNIAQQKALEDEAQNNVQILAYRLTNKESNKVVELPFDQYLNEFKQYPKEEWEAEQIKSEPEIEKTKISDFEISDENGNGITEQILSDDKYAFMLVAVKLKANEELEPHWMIDTTYVIDTLRTSDTTILTRKIDAVTKKQVYKELYEWDGKYVRRWQDFLNPVIEDAEKGGIKTFAITSYAEPSKIDDFRHEAQTAFPFYQADDILLKTIIRSNPGVVLLKNGEIIEKWHYKKLPSFEEIQNNYMN
ncbi:MAG: DoxX family protein [Bacteroidetes bacterium]|nr:DoxX family protein [Bacteroidota bacterium]